jgi:hypothetical protein
MLQKQAFGLTKQPMDQRGCAVRTKHKSAEIKWIRVLHELDVESKLDRDPSFMQGLMAYGKEQAGEFLNQRAEVSKEGQEIYRHAANAEIIRFPARDVSAGLLEAWFRHHPSSMSRTASTSPPTA